MAGYGVKTFETLVWVLRKLNSKIVYLFLYISSALSLWICNYCLVTIFHNHGIWAVTGWDPDPNPSVHPNHGGEFWVTGIIRKLPYCPENPSWSSHGRASLRSSPHPLKICQEQKKYRKNEKTVKSSYFDFASKFLVLTVPHFCQPSLKTEMEKLRI